MVAYRGHPLYEESPFLRGTIKVLEAVSLCRARRAEGQLLRAYQIFRRDDVTTFGLSDAEHVEAYFMTLPIFLERGERFSGGKFQRAASAVSRSAR